MKTIFVSGCFDILTAGHVKFLNTAKNLGDKLVVCIASDRTFELYKGKARYTPVAHKRYILENLTCVDKVLVGDTFEKGLEFKDVFLDMKPDMLVATEDDKFKEQKEKLCKEAGARFIVLPKDGLDEPILSSDQLQELLKVPLRVDFAGAWLDVPFFSIKGAYIVNCAISPRVSPTDWPYRKQGNLGESAAWNYLQGRDAVEGDLKLGVGWQNPAVIKETGLCVWKSGATPVLALKDSGKMLAGKMALMWTGEGKNVEEIVGKLRDYKAIRHAADLAKEAVLKQNIYKMAHAVNLTHDLQVSEGMLPLPMLENCLGRKYCGEGFGGYALYLFEDTEQRDKASKFVPLTPVEPYYK